jgi:hypothetical protein
MSLKWFNTVKLDLSKLPDLVDHFNQQADLALEQTKIKGSLERAAQHLPGIMAERFTQLQELEAVLKHLNLRYDKIRSDHYRRYLERYNRELSDRAIEKYIDGESDIQDMSDLINEVALVRNKYLAVIKALESKSYSINNIVKLRTAGLEESQLD